MITFPGSKINAGLFVTSVLPDGYHTIESALIPLGWSDILEIIIRDSASNNAPTSYLPDDFEITDDRRIRLTMSGLPVDCPINKNLVVKAYYALNRITPLPPVDIYLRKIVPDGAGLGGGSADASATIVMLNEMLALGMSHDELADIAAEIGADCPFFIYNRPMIATGTGTTLSDLTPKPWHGKIVVARADISVSTAQAYQRVTISPSHINLRQTLSEMTPDKWHEAGISNSFEPSVAELVPQVDEILHTLKKHGAIYASMSGSGSAVFGLFDNDKMAEQAVKALDNLPHYIGDMSL